MNKKKDVYKKSPVPPGNSNVVSGSMFDTELLRDSNNTFSMSDISEGIPLTINPFEEGISKLEIFSLCFLTVGIAIMAYIYFPISSMPEIILLP